MQASFFPLSRLQAAKRFSLIKLPKTTRLLTGFRPLCTSTTTTISIPESAIEEAEEQETQPLKHSLLLEKLRLRHLKCSAKPQSKTSRKSKWACPETECGWGLGKSENKKKREVENFGGLGLTEEVLAAVREMDPAC
ncbi:DEAD-box ATP-dependent RNA helicase 39 [Prunus yedoensis var. nudiflora]|uniref:DEAD-box ATP-dependent RNA helicase 39 n=1 Tax=Prunus yedoensis var. nudiflora TaxID=2094558 RepID=A0A314YF77_PRUYE|nr:DEAD-box ATP-dependent RNA helicase 39 [Prunus yedoensis var. nudiflora]